MKKILLSLCLAASSAFAAAPPTTATFQTAVVAPTTRVLIWPASRTMFVSDGRIFVCPWSSTVSGGVRSKSCETSDGREVWVLIQENKIPGFTFAGMSFMMTAQGEIQTIVYYSPEGSK